MKAKAASLVSPAASAADDCVTFFTVVVGEFVGSFIAVVVTDDADTTSAAGESVTFFTVVDDDFVDSFITVVATDDDGTDVGAVVEVAGVAIDVDVVLDDGTAVVMEVVGTEVETSSSLTATVASLLSALEDTAFTSFTITDLPLYLACNSFLKSSM